MPGDSPALLWVSDRIAGIIRVVCEMINSKTASRKFVMQTKHAADIQNCKTNRNMQAKLDAGSMSADETNTLDCLNSYTGRTNMPHYFLSSDNKKADKRVSEATVSTIHNEFSDFFLGIGYFQGTFSLQV